MYRILRDKETLKKIPGFMQSGGDALHPHQIVDVVTKAFSLKYADEKAKPIRTQEELLVEFAPELEVATEAYRQSNLDTLRLNAINAGLDPEKVEAVFVTDAEYAVLLEALIPEPTEAQLYEAAIKVKEAEILRRQAIAELEAEKIEAED